jgi:hypothetical protein
MAAAYGSSPIHAPDSLEGYSAPHDSLRSTGEALSRLGSAMPFMGPLKQGLGLFLIQAYSPILKPFEILNLLTNHMFSRLAPGLADKSYELLYKVIPTGLISKAAEKIGLGGGITNQVSKFLIGGLAKAGIKTNGEDIKTLTNELGKSLSDIYNPKFLKQFDNFFTRALKEGERPYMEVAEALIEKSLANVGETVSKALSQGMNAISDGTAQAAVTEAIKDTAQKTTDRVKQTANLATQKIQNTQKQILDDSKQALNKGKQIASQAVQSITPQTQKPATDKTDKKDKKAQGPNNNSQPGLFSNLLTTGSNIIKSITGIFSPKPAPAAA